MAIAISVDNAHVSTGNVTIHVSGLSGDDDPVALYIDDVKVSNDINPGYYRSFDYTYAFNTKGVYSVKCTYHGVDSNVLTLYVGYDFSIAFDEDAYYTCNGNCTVTATLTESNVGVSGAAVTLTGAGSTAAATTDSNGVATFNLSSIAENKSLTVSYANSSDTVTLTYLDNTTLMGSLYCLGRRLETNLKAKGITDIDFTDGLSALVDEIPNIEPSIGGIVLDTALTCSASRNSVPVGSTVTFTGKLSCSYDDSGQSDDDMEGYIKTALIEFYNGNTLLGSTSTDTNGEYSFSYLTSATGTLSVIASYDGTDFYEDCVSSAVSVVVVSPTPDSISLTSDKSVLSYADIEYATLTATVLDAGGNPVSGETVSFDIVDSTGATVIENIGSATTGSAGTCNVSYYSKGTGTLYIKASTNGIIQSIISVEDISYADIGDSDKSSNYDVTNAKGSMTHNTDHYTISRTSGSHAGILIKDLLVGANVQLDCDLKINAVSNEQFCLAVYKASNNTGVSACSMIAPSYGQSQVMIRYNTSQSSIGSEYGTRNWSHSDWHHLTLICQDGNVTAKFDNTQVTISYTYSLENSNKIGFTTYAGNTNGTFDIKNIKVKEL